MGFDKNRRHQQHVPGRSQVLGPPVPDQICVVGQMLVDPSDLTMIPTPPDGLPRCSTRFCQVPSGAEDPVRVLDPASLTSRDGRVAVY